MSDLVWPDGYGLLRYPTLESTNSEAQRLAQAGERGPLWVTANRQTAGRGRRGREWQQGEGNLAATLLLAPPRNFAQLSFVAALAVADTATHFAPHAAITLKWPNDLLADGRKLAGILLEAGDEWLAIGVGVNLASHPADTEFPATDLSVFGKPPAPQAALTVLAACFASWYDAWMTQGFDKVRAAWLARAAGLGARIRARLPDETCHGVFQDIDADGALLLNQNGRVRTIAAGEVFF